MAHPRRMGWSAGRVLWWLAALVPLLLLALMLFVENRHPDFAARADTSDILVIALSLLVAAVGIVMAAAAIVNGMAALTAPFAPAGRRGRTAQLVERSRLRTKAAALIAVGAGLLLAGLLLALSRALPQLWPALAEPL